MVKVYIDNSTELAQKYSNYKQATTTKTSKVGNHTYKKVGTKNHDYSEDIMYRVYQIGRAILTTAVGLTIIPIIFSDYRKLVTRFWNEAISGVEKLSLYLLETNEPITTSEPKQTSTPLPMVKITTPPPERQTPPPERQTPPPSPTSIKTSKTPSSLTPPTSPEQPQNSETPRVNRVLKFDNVDTPIPSEPTTPVPSEPTTPVPSEPTTPVRPRSQTGVPERRASGQPSTPLKPIANINEEDQLLIETERKLRNGLIQKLEVMTTALLTHDQYGDVIYKIFYLAYSNQDTFNIKLVQKVLEMDFKKSNHKDRLEKIKETLISD